MRQQYNLSNVMEGQPLLVNVDEKTKRESYFLPQYCSLTGLSDENRKNFGLMRELANKSNMDAYERLSKIA